MKTDPAVWARVSAPLVNILLQHLKVKDENGDLVPALTHDLEVKMSKSRKLQTHGTLYVHEKVLERVRESNEFRGRFAPIYQPMLVPPMPWERYDKGGYLDLKTAMMRTHGSRSQVEALRHRDMDKVYQGLNGLQNVAWRVNSRILECIEQASFSPP
jgi:Mitochondrial DNA-directed RNA polymerase